MRSNALAGQTLGAIGAGASLPAMFKKATDGLRKSSRLGRFEAVVLPHLDAAYDLARWLTRSDDHAEDVLQTACLRALKFFATFQGGNPRAWLLTIVRNTFYNWLRQNRAQELATPFDEELHSDEPGSPDPPGPEAELLRKADSRLLRQALEELPVTFREAIVLRELEGLSYKEIATIADIPIGTVMSRLSRARRLLQHYLLSHGVVRGPGSSGNPEGRGSQGGQQTRVSQESQEIPKSRGSQESEGSPS
jgi:RNA polymerase sigma factor (sigma-70 family)